MITIYYDYRVKAGEWRRGYKEFYDVEKAIRFIYSLKRKKDSCFITGVECEYQEDDEYITQRVKGSVVG